MFFIALAVIIGVILFYRNNKKIKEDTLEAEDKLTETGLDKFYQKQGNELCVNEKNKQKQDDISRDMLWTLQLDGKSPQKAEKIKCANGEIGIKIN